MYGKELSAHTDRSATRVLAHLHVPVLIMQLTRLLTDHRRRMFICFDYICRLDRAGISSTIDDKDIIASVHDGVLTDDITATTNSDNLTSEVTTGAKVAYITTYIYMCYTYMCAVLMSTDSCSLYMLMHLLLLHTTGTRVCTASYRYNTSISR
jgi:hypothetical protein